jgi:ATP-binding cassette subfamily B protein
MFKIYRQKNAFDCGPICLKMIAKHYGREVDLDYIKKLCKTNSEGTTLLDLSTASEKIGFNTLKAKVSKSDIDKIPLPFIAHWDNFHYIIVYKITRKHFYVADPAKGKIKYTREDFFNYWAVNEGDEGYVLGLEPSAEFNKEKSLKISFIKEILVFLTPHKKIYFQVVFALLLGTIIQIILPVLSQLFIDRGVGERDTSLLFLIICGQFVLTIGGIFTNFIRSITSLHLGTIVNVSIVSDFIKRILKMPISFFENKQVGDILQRINDNDRIEQFLTESLVNILFSILNLFIFTTILAIYSLKIFVVFLIGSVLYMTWIILFQKRRKKIDRELFGLNSNNTSALLEIFEGVNDIKFFNIEKNKRWEWEREQARIYKANRKMLIVNQIQSSGSITINTLKNFIILYIAATSVINGQISLGMLFAIQFVLGQANAPIAGIMVFVRDLQFAKLSFERLNEINNEIQTVTSEGVEVVDPEPISDDISVSNVSFSYSQDNSDFSFENLSVTFPKNSITVVVGESGSGKSTILKLLLKYYVPSQGEIRIGNSEIGSIDSQWWYKNTGAVLQNGYIFSDTIRNNVALGDETVDEKRMREAIEMVNLDKFVQSLPDKYDTMLGKGGNELSQGQRQRILIARLVYKNPKYVFLDEATNFLDSENETIILNNLKTFLKDKTTIIVDHKLSAIKSANKIIVVDSGKIVEEGTHESLMKLNSKYSNLIKQQKELNNTDFNK